MTDFTAAIYEAAILAELDTLNQETRDRIRERLDAGDRKTVRDGETEIGQVWVTNPKPRWSIVDHAAYGRWVDEHAPEAIVISRQVNASFTQRVTRAGVVAVEQVDPETGEVTTVDMTPDGIALVKGAPSLTVKPNDAAKLRALEMVRGVLAIEAT